MGEGNKQNSRQSSLEAFAKEVGMPPGDLADATLKGIIEQLDKELVPSFLANSTEENGEKILRGYQAAQKTLPEASKKYLKQQFGQRVAERVIRTHAGGPLLLLDKHVLKPIVKKGRLTPEEVHLLSYQDAQNQKLNNNQFRQVDVFKPLVRGDQVNLELQLRKIGTTLGDLPAALDVKSLDEGSLEQLVPIFFEKPLQDIFFWYAQNLEITRRNGHSIPIKIDKLNRKRIHRLEESIKNAQKLAGCNLDDNDVHFVQQTNQILQELLPHTTKFHARGLNPTPFNIMLEHDFGEITDENRLSVLKQANPKKLLHLDRLVRTGYTSVTECLIDYIDSPALRQLQFKGKRNIFGKGTSRNAYDTLASNKEWKYHVVKEAQHEALAYLRVMRLRDHILSGYMPQLFATRKIDPEYKEGLANYESEIRYLDAKAQEHLGILIQLCEAQPKLKNTLQRLLGITDKMASFKMNAVVDNLERTENRK